MNLVVSPIDLREEMDDRRAAPASISKTNASITKPHHQKDAKAKFLIRMLPRECNPTPIPSNNTSSLLSPTGRRPLSPESETHLQENPFDDITEEKLQKLSGKQDLSRVTFLQLSVDSSKQSVEVIGELLPSLQQLKLEKSVLHSFRDLGTSLHSLQILWVMRSGLSDLDGIGALTGLQELYLQHNNISDISPLTMHEELQIVDLEGNCISDIGQIEQLAFCPQLTSLNLDGNPVCTIQHYRQIVTNFVPQLKMLDNKNITAAEQIKLSDDVIDAAIQAHQEALAAAASTPAVDEKPQLAEGIKSSGGDHLDGRTINTLSRIPSTSRVIGFDPPNALSIDDAGSSLTHGSDIVFAGNVTSALRRHRSENESDSPRKATTQILQRELNYEPAPILNSNQTKSSGNLERPKTPARMSITDTLDRANELETQKHKSRDTILSELKAWQLESAAEPLGVTHVVVPQRNSPGKSPKRKIVSSSSHRRPNTSAGVMRNGVKEAFVDITNSKEDRERGKPAIHPGMRQRSSFSSSSTSPAVDILFLDVSDDTRPCSPSRTSNGIFVTGGIAREWNLDALSPKLNSSDPTAKPMVVPSSLSAKKQHDRISRITQEESDDSSDSDCEETSKPATRNSPKLVEPPSTAFFNVAESLLAIDRWRDAMEDDDKIVSVRSYHQECLSPRALAPTADSSVPSKSITAAAICSNSDQQSNQRSPNKTNTSHQLVFGPAVQESDEVIVQYMRQKHPIVAETKTRDGFRRYFQGIEQERLERILHQVFSDSEKVRRRMQLMNGFFSA